MGKTTVQVSAWKDGFPLSVTLFTPWRESAFVVVINAATMMDQRFYEPFATLFTYRHS